MDDAEEFLDEWDHAPKSKTQVKKEMTALQEFGVSLTDLNAQQLDRLPLEEALRKAIDMAKGLKQRSAKRRQLQYIGKLMRNTNYDELQQAYAEMQELEVQATRQHHLIEQWRDSLIQGDEQVLQGFINDFPQVDRQQLHQLVRAAKQEVSQEKPPASGRKLFRFIRELLVG